MPCNKVSINKNYKCNKSGCICIQTDGKPCICVCENEDGVIVRCDDCKCYSDTCQCKCDDSKCTCIVTKGASCVCVCRDERGNFKTCDCCCIESDKARPCCEKVVSPKACECCNKKPEKKSCGTHCKCNGKKELQESSRYVVFSKKYKCNQPGCICIPTDGKPCICVCENEDGDIVRCDNCKCYSDTCQCKCDDSKCTCIVTKGASCVCVCRDERGNFKTCDCCCIESDKARSCCEKEVPQKFLECCSKKLVKKTCGTYCKCGGKKEFQESRRNVVSSKNYKCNQSGCICIPTDGKPCICVCENEDGDIVRCDDCKCYSDICQCKCDSSKCTCIVTKGASCVCVCRDERGNFKTCVCCCIESDKAKTCCEKEVRQKSLECCSKKLEKKSCGTYCKCNGKKELQESRRNVVSSKNYRCNQLGCICIPTDGKPCICVCEKENGDIVRCDDCKCYSGTCKCDDPKCTCIVAQGASCVCMCRDERGNCKTCICSCIESDKLKSCCKKELSMKSYECCSKKVDKKTGCDCDGKRSLQVARRNVAISKNCKCNQPGCLCIPTDSKPCICICKNEDGDILRCDDCKCDSDTCQKKCDDSKCTCIATKGASCVCVCRDKRGNFRTCMCSCIEMDKAKPCCKTEVSMKSDECCSKKVQKKTSGSNCECDGKGKLQHQTHFCASNTKKSVSCSRENCIAHVSSKSNCNCN